MSTSVIDALVVTLGMDSKGFNDGISKAMGSLTGFATKVAGLALGFEGLAAGIRYFEALHVKLADLEFAAQNLGVLGTSLSKLGEMAKMFGGSFDDAKSSVEGLQGAVYNLRFHGQMSEQLMALNRWHVAYLDQQGHVLPEVDIARNAAKAIDWQSARTPGGMEPGQRRQMALDLLGASAGGLASAAAAGVAKFDEVWKRVQKDQKGLSEGMLHSNQKMYQDIDVSGRTQREIQRMPVLEAMIPALEKMNDELTELASKAMPWLAKQITDLTAAILHPNGAAKAMVDAAKTIAKSVDKFYDSTILPPTKPGEKPVSALAPIAGGYRLGETLRDRFDEWMSQFTGLPLSAVPHPVAHGVINRSPAVIPHALVTPLAPRPPASGSGSKPTAMNGAPTTTITFENVVVQPRGQDGKAFADAFVDQTRRKLLAASSERGLA